MTEQEQYAGFEPDAAVTAEIDALVEHAGITRHRAHVSRLIASALRLGLDDTQTLDVKISTAALEEMREAFTLFAPYREVPKVTIFGSARTLATDPLSQHAGQVSRRLAELGWMVVTGAGPGIMEAAATGAGPEQSLGVSIRLPFEETPQTDLTGNDRHVAMKYFFTRKLMLVKESSGFVCMPGGFGTMDETFELLTLQQTGKAVPVPIVLLDRPGGTFWQGFMDFVIDELEGTGMISPGDMDRVLVTDSVDAAVDEITGFWRNYDSLRWVGDRLVLRLRFEPSDAEVHELNERWGVAFGAPGIVRSDPLKPEVADRDRLELHRIALTPNRREVGELHRLIRDVNTLPSANQART